MIALAHTPAWQALAEDVPRASTLEIAKLVEWESDRADRMMPELQGILFDLTRQRADARVMERLQQLALQQDVAGHMRRQMAGEPVNASEGRAAWHTALRAQNPPAEVASVLAQMRELSQKLRADKNLRHVVHIGIGGSDLGPRLVYEALAGLHDGPEVHFVANVDPDDMDPLLMRLDPARTIVTVASKTFATSETLLNLRGIRMWLKGHDEHVYAITANTQAAVAQGFAADHVLPLWDWVGGRFSVWSAVGMPIALAFGFDVFEAFLAGARAADHHAATAAPERNIPLLMALLGVWNRCFLGMPVLAVVPYGQRLAGLVPYLQQVIMESNGKGVDLTGRTGAYDGASVVFGQPGTNAQHAFFQMLHQGLTPIPCEFVAARDPAGCPARHKPLLANMLAQARALMIGDAGGGDPQRLCPGNRPSVTIVLPRVDAASLGTLMAVYEHRTVAEAVLMGINPYDQFGVELGKTIAKDLLAPQGVLEQNQTLDKSTIKLIFHTFLGK